MAGGVVAGRRGVTRRGVVAGALCLCCRPRVGWAAALEEVAPGVHVRRGLTADAAAGNDDAIANVGFVVGGRSVAVIDPGGSVSDGQWLRAAIARVTTLPVRTVVMTHVHPDHVFGAAAFLADRPDFVGHARLPQALAARGGYYRQALERVLGAGRAGPVVMPTVLVEGTRRIDLGGRVLALSAHPPAHTDCDVSVVDEGSGILLTGDLLFVDRVPALDGDLAGWIGVLKGMQASGVRQAVPGHGPALVGLAGAVAPLLRYLTVLQREVRAAVAAGTPIEQAQHEIAGSERPHWALFDDYNARNVIEAWRQIEWE